VLYTPWADCLRVGRTAYPVMQLQGIRGFFAAVIACQFAVAGCAVAGSVGGLDFGVLAMPARALQVVVCQHTRCCRRVLLPVDCCTLCSVLLSAGVLRKLVLGACCPSTELSACVLAFPQHSMPICATRPAPLSRDLLCCGLTCHFSVWVFSLACQQ
jgi:hypothetical protein